MGLQFWPWSVNSLGDRPQCSTVLNLSIGTRRLPIPIPYAPILLAPRGKQVPLEAILDGLPRSVTDVFVTDCYLDGIENESPIPGLSAGFLKTVARGERTWRVVNIDHHAPDPRTERHVSSGNLALEWVATHGPADPATAVVVINHTDCDSIIAAAVLSGRVDAQAHGAILGQAVLAADHTNQPLPLAELLQAFDHHRDLDLSLSQLAWFLCGKPPSTVVEVELARRNQDRGTFAALVADRLRWHGSIAVLELDEPRPHLDNAFFPPLVPTATLCMLAFPASAEPGARLMVKLRLGLAAPLGLKLNNLPFDPGFGGRWNAGGNNRAGGTNLLVNRYLDLLQEWLKC